MAALTKVVTDSVGLRDTRYGWGRRWGRGFGGPASFTVARVNVDPVAYERAATDLLTLTDRYARLFGPVVRDHVGVTEGSFSRVNGRITITITESVGASDSPGASATGRARSVSDPLVLTDVTAQTRGFARTVADAVVLTDVVTRGFVVTVTDDVAMTDPSQIERMYLRSALDRMGITDAVSTTGGGRRTLTDAVGLTDSIAVRLVALDVPGTAVLFDVLRGTAVLAPASRGTATLVAVGLGGTAVVTPQQKAAATVQRDVSAGGTAVLYRTRTTP